ncbi:MAG: DegT/DnrJ/EryC1/StrS family aminotransferase [Bryobacteraceae bacterium]
MTNSKIPFLDLVASHEELKEELCEVFARVLKTAAFVGGATVEGFERDFAEFCGTQHCVGVASGTDAVRFALMAAGLRKGAIAVTVPNTFIATTEAITQAGGCPDFVDVDARTYNMDPEKLREYLEVHCFVNPTSGDLVSRKSGRPVAAVVPVHLYGQTADMDRILELAERYKLVVIEDACQAHGAEYYSAKKRRWRKAGSMGHAAAFSFYPGKNLGACGEGGAVTTNDVALAQRIRMLRDHGQTQKYYHEVEGYNGRLDAIQAGILQVKLKHLAEWNACRREAATQYREQLLEAGMGELVPYEPDWSKAIYHLYVIQAQDRDGLMRHLADLNIGTGIHYPVPLHLQKAYEWLGHKPGEFPVAEKAAAEIVSLPMFPQLTSDQQRRVVSCIREFQATKAPRAVKYAVASY